jgi:hypothetical protein
VPLAGDGIGPRAAASRFHGAASDEPSPPADARPRAIRREHGGIEDVAGGEDERIRQAKLAMRRSQPSGALGDLRGQGLDPDTELVEKAFHEPDRLRAGPPRIDQGLGNSYDVSGA